MSGPAALPYIPQAFTNAVWTEEPWQFFVAVAPTSDVPFPPPVQDDFTGCTFSAGLRDPNTGSTILQMTDGNGLLSYTSPNEIVPLVDKTTMEGLAQYVVGDSMLCDFDLTVTYPDGFTQPLIVTSVNLVRGVAA